MESNLSKINELEILGSDYIFIIHDAQNGKAILKCSHAAQYFIDESHFIQDFLEYFNNFANTELLNFEENSNASNLSNKIEIKTQNFVNNIQLINNNAKRKNLLTTLNKKWLSKAVKIDSKKEIPRLQSQIDDNCLDEIISENESIMPKPNNVEELFKINYESADCLSTNENQLSNNFLSNNMPYLNDRFACLICNKIFPSTELLKRHDYNVHMDNFVSCSMCDKLIKSRKMKYHVTKVHRLSRFKCSKCPKTFKWHCSLDMHLEDHAAMEAGINDSFKCENCNKNFRSHVRLRHHQQRKSCFTQKTTNHSILCPICGNNYRSNLTLTVHLRLKHCNGELSGVIPLQQFQCLVCSRFYNSKSKLKAHSRCHTGDRPFRCQFCNKGFAYKHYLKKHNKNMVCMKTSVNIR